MQSGTSRSVQHRYRQGCGSTWWVLEGSMWSPAIFGQHPWNIMEPSYIGVQQKFLKTTEIPFMARIFPNSADIFFGDGNPRGNHPEAEISSAGFYRYTKLLNPRSSGSRLAWNLESHAHLALGRRPKIAANKGTKCPTIAIPLSITSENTWRESRTSQETLGACFRQWQRTPKTYSKNIRKHTLICLTPQK